MLLPFSGEQRELIRWVNIRKGQIEGIIRALSETLQLIGRGRCAGEEEWEGRRGWVGRRVPALGLPGEVGGGGEEGG